MYGYDTIYGGDGNDIVKAGGHDDTVIGGSGADVLAGEDGNDELYAGYQNSFSGDDAVDKLYGGNGDDFLYIHEGDFAYGGDGEDVIWMYEDNAFASGGNDSDTIYAGLGGTAYFGDDTAVLAFSFIIGGVTITPTHAEHIGNDLIFYNESETVVTAQDWFLGDNYQAQSIAFWNVDTQNYDIYSMSSWLAVTSDL